MDWLTQLLMQLGSSGAMAQGGLSDMGAGGVPPEGFGTPPMAPEPSMLPPPTMPSIGVDESGVGSPMGPMGLPSSATPTAMPPTPAQSLGASLEPGAPAGSPMDIRSMAQKRMGGSQAMTPGASNALVAALRGASQPAKPDVVKPSTPAAPQTRAIQGGDFMALLQSLSNPRRPLQTPQTLGGALGTGRY